MNAANPDSISLPIRPKLRWHPMFYVAALSVVALALFFFTLSAEKPYMGAFLSLQNERWVVQSVDPEGAAKQAGIVVDDIPEIINGQPANAFLKQYLKHGFVHGLLIESLTVRGGTGEVKSVDLNESPLSPRAAADLVAWFLLCVIFWLAGFDVYRRKPKNPAAILLCVAGLVVGLALSGNMAGERGIQPAIHITAIAATIGPWLLLHFFLVLPDERSHLYHNPRIYLLYLPAAVIILLYPFFGYADGQPLQDFRLVRLVGYGVGFLGVIGVAVANYLRAVSWKTRQQMKIILIGSLAAVIPFVALSVLPATTDSANVMPASFSVLFLGLIPFSMGYAVITRKLMDIDFIIQRGVVYGLITLLMGAIVVTAISITLLVREPGSVYERILIALALGGLATVSFGPAKKWIELGVDRVFYKDRYEHRAILRELSGTLNRLTDIAGASSIIVNTLMRTLNLAGAGLYIRTHNDDLPATASQGIFMDNARIEERLGEFVLKRKSSLEFPNSASAIDAEIAFLVPLLVADQEIGFLLLAPKASRQNFSPADMHLIQDVAALAAVSLRSILVIANDVSERKRYQEALKHAAEEWRTTFDSIADMIAIIDRERKIVRVNRAFADAFGLNPQDLIGRHCFDVVHQTRGPHPLCTLDDTLASSLPCNHELFEATLGKHLECTMSPLIGSSGDIVGVVHVFKDITQRKNIEAEQQIMRARAEISSRLASVGEMAAGIAHEINNPLTGVIGFSELLLHEDLPANIKEDVRIIAEGSNRVKEIVRRLLTFARQAKPQKASLDIHELIDNTLELRRYVLNTANIEIIKRYDHSLPWITVDPGQVQQVFMNIIVNAEYAMKKAHGQGKLEISTRREDNYVAITFKDNGPGIPPDILAKLFNPFFTTKEPGEGTGLGLSVSRSIILEHDGMLAVESQPGQGAVFIIRLPVTATDKTLHPDSKSGDRREKPSRCAKVLVVDDEAAVRSVVKRCLEDFGHSVSQAASFNEALLTMAQTEFDIIFLDMRMPGKSGKDLYAEIKLRWPAASHGVIFITGDISDSNTIRFFKDNSLPFVAKPFDQETLNREVNKLLAKPA